jgi:hypothetical protein
MIALCWLHVGTEKTGTTTIQRFLASNRNNLRAQSVLYPMSPGETNHLALAASGMDGHRLDPIQLRCGIRQLEEIPTYRARTARRLGREAAASGASSVILSNEHLSMKLTKREEIIRIKEICDGFAEKTRVIIYLRNQTDFLVSRYNTAVNAGSTDQFTVSLTPGVAAFLDYATMLEPWTCIFGRENLIVRRFETADFPNGDLLQDFAACTGIDHGRMEPVEPANKSLTGPALAFLREFNRRFPLVAEGKNNPLRGKITSLLASFNGGRDFSIPPELATVIDSRYRDSNERTAREYFGSRYMPLFSPPRCVGSEEFSNDRIDPDQAIAIAAHLWGAQQRTINRFIRLEKRRQRTTTGTEQPPERTATRRDASPVRRKRERGERIRAD